MSSAEWSFRAPAFDSVQVSKLSRAFGRTHALYDVNLEFRSAEVSCLVGPNGAGKSTLLSLLSTLDRPTDGAVRFGDSHDGVKHREHVRPHIGVVAHDSLLYGDLTGLENLRFCAQLYGRHLDEAAEWLGRVGLGDTGDKLVSSYSRGMKQRLSIARALLPEPTLVLFDEPLTGLDRDAREFFFKTVKRLRTASRIVVVVTHHLTWPSDAMDRLVVLDRGRVRFDGPPLDDVLEIYAQKVRA